jgi:hypothetical protein
MVSIIERLVMLLGLLEVLLDLHDELVPVTWLVVDRRESHVVRKICPEGRRVAAVNHLERRSPQ